MSDSDGAPHPLDGVDDLGEAVLLGLSRPAGWKQSPRPIRTAIEALITFGFVPILHWQTILKQFAILEQQQFEHLAEWVRRSGRAHAGEQLLGGANGVRPSRWLRGVIYLFVLAAAVILAGYFWSVDVHEFIRRVSFTLGESRADKRFDLIVCFALTGVCLAMAYLLHWREVVGYTKSASRFEQRFLSLIDRPHEPVPAHVANVVRRRGSVAWAVPFVMLPFGPFMALAGMAQARALLVTSRVRRANLAVQLRGMMNADRKEVAVPMPFPLRRRCENPLCEAILEPSAHFCPRCGKRA